LKALNIDMKSNSHREFTDAVVSLAEPINFTKCFRIPKSEIYWMRTR
jgi:hypothetical protein